MVDIQSATAKVRREIKKDRKIETTGQKYNVRICYAGPAHVVRWLDHLGAMCSRVWRALYAVGSIFNSSRGLGKARPPT